MSLRELLELRNKVIFQTAQVRNSALNRIAFLSILCIWLTGAIRAKSTASREGKTCRDTESRSWDDERGKEKCRSVIAKDLGRVRWAARHAQGSTGSSDVNGWETIAEK